MLIKPKTYMNESGGPVAGLQEFFDVPIAQVIVVHDELDLDSGVVRVKLGGGDNGHNGLALSDEVAREQGLSEGAPRGRSAARADGPGRLRAA